MQKTAIKEKLTVVGCALISFTVLLMIWHLAVTFTDLGLMMSSPLTVIRAFFVGLVEPLGPRTLIGHTAYSLYRVMVGYGLCAVVGIVLGILMGQIRVIDAIIRPVFNLIRPIPGVAWIPLAILWFGIGEKAKYFIIFMGGFANVLLNTYEGTKTVDQKLVGAARMLGASRRQVFTYIVMPATVPYIFAGLQVALSTCWMAVLAAEMVCATEGVGFLINAGMSVANTTQILIGMVSIGIVGLMLASFMRWLERRLCAWKIKGT